MLEATHYQNDFTFGNKLPLLLTVVWVVEVLHPFGKRLPLQLLPLLLDDANSQVLPVGGVVNAFGNKTTTKLWK